MDVVERDVLEQLLRIGLETLTQYMASAGDGDEGKSIEHRGRKLVRLDAPKQRVYGSILAWFKSG